MHGKNHKIIMNKLYIYVLVLMIFMGVGASWVIEKANASHEIPIIKKVPNFNFTNQNGETFSQNQLKNKITVLDFFLLIVQVHVPL